MDKLLAAFQWIMENKEIIGSIVFSLLAVASVITKLTPSAKDDEWVAKIIGWFSFLQPKGVSGLKFPGTTPNDSPPELFQDLDDEE